jgi:hypothetical protein
VIEILIQSRVSGVDLPVFPKDGLPAIEESGKYLEILKQEATSLEVLQEHLEQ